MCLCCEEEAATWRELETARRERDAAKEALAVMAHALFVRNHKSRFRLGIGQPTIKESPMLELSITNEQKITVTIKPVTDTGRDVALDGAPTWEVQSGTSTVVPAADGLSAELISSDEPGDTVFVITADTAPGEEIENISDIVRLTVVGARAKNLGLSAGEPVAK